MGSVAKEAAANLTQVATAATAAAPAIETLGSKLTAFQKAIRDLQYGSGASVTDGATRSEGSRAHQAEGVARLEALDAQLKAAFGANNQFSGIIDRNLTSLRNGDYDVDSFIKYFAAIANSSFAGLQQEALSNNPQIRALALLLERIAQSGRLQ